MFLNNILMRDSDLTSFLETKSWNDIHREVSLVPQLHRYDNMLLDFADLIRGSGKTPYTYEHDLYVHKATLAACGFDVRL